MSPQDERSLRRRILLGLGLKRAAELESDRLLNEGPGSKFKSTGFGAVREFKAFILRGNVVDLAIGVVIGAAFGTVVSSLVENLVTPMTGVFGNLPDFGSLAVRVGRARLRYGAFVNDMLSFLIVSLVIFFFVVKPLNKLMNKTPLSVGALERDCTECLGRIPADARRCMYCTTEFAKAPDRQAP
jgi:large conductance mechanosensitive channel